MFSGALVVLLCASFGCVCGAICACAVRVVRCHITSTRRSRRELRMSAQLQRILRFESCVCRFRMWLFGCVHRLYCVRGVLRVGAAARWGVFFWCAPPSAARARRARGARACRCFF